jgi:hypothetical protein
LGFKNINVDKGKPECLFRFRQNRETAETGKKQKSCAVEDDRKAEENGE